MIGVVSVGFLTESAGRPRRRRAADVQRRRPPPRSDDGVPLERPEE
ncbi:hypothetical protein [Actinomycetospora cinnamomea]|nr:hypothetical protein [Actinomycetospora cinnamomea]